MSRQNQKNFLKQLASLVGVASTSALLSFPAMALTNSHSRSSAQPLNNSVRIAQSEQPPDNGGQPSYKNGQSSNNQNPANNTGSKPTTYNTRTGPCQIPPSRPTGGATRKKLQATRHCNTGSRTAPANTNSQQTTPDGQ